MTVMPTTIVPMPMMLGATVMNAAMMFAAAMMTAAMMFATVATAADVCRRDHRHARQSFGWQHQCAHNC
jgi:hypothetical protein